MQRCAKGYSQNSSLWEKFLGNTPFRGERGPSLTRKIFRFLRDVSGNYASLRKSGKNFRKTSLYTLHISGLMIRVSILIMVKLMICILGPVLLITMFLIKPYNTDCIDIEPKTEDKIETKTSTEVKRQSKASVRSEKIVELRSTQIGQSLLVGLLSNFVALVFVSDNIYLKFSATYFQYIDLQLTASQSAHLVIQMAIVYTLGRAMAVLVSIRIRPQTIMSYHIFILITSLVVIFFGQQNYRILWTGSLLLSLGFSAILPAIFAFVGQYIEVNNRMGTVIIFNCGSLNSFLPFILGTFIEYYPNTFLTIILINFSIAIVIFAIIIYLTNEPDS